VRNVIPSKIYRHPGGLREERDRLLSESHSRDDYQSGSDSAKFSSSGGPSESVRISDSRKNINLYSSQTEDDDDTLGEFTELGNEHEIND